MGGMKKRRNQDRFEKMLELRNRGMTLEEIGAAQDPRVSKQRVIQILGKTGHKAALVRAKHILEFPADVTDEEVAEQVGLSTAHVGVIRARRWRASANGSTGVSSQGQLLVARRLDALGIEYQMMGRRHAYNILAFSKTKASRILLRVRGKPTDLGENKGNPGYTFFSRTPKEAFDVFVGVALDVDTCFVIPAAEFPDGLSIRIPYPEYERSKYIAFKEKWSILT